MLILPIAQENNIVRRVPWVSYTLIGANVLGFWLTSFVFAAAGGTARAERSLDAVMDYLGEHPYLTVNAELGERLGNRFEAALDKLRAEFEQERQPATGVAREREQEDLDALSRKALEEWHALPVYKAGFRAREDRSPTILSHMFMHSGLLHLLGNMLFLFLSGPFLEDVYGRPLFAGLYFLSGLAALSAHVIQAPDDFVPLVGASGAIAGVMGAFLIRLGGSWIQFLVLPIILPVIRFKMFLPAFLVLPLWAGQQYVYATYAKDAGVAWWAHLGGFGFGLLAAIVLALTGIEKLVINPKIEEETTLQGNPAIERALEARVAGKLGLARSEIKNALSVRPDDADALRESLEIALVEQDPQEVARTVARLLEVYPRMKEAGLANQLLRDERLDRDDLPARFYMAVAAFLEKQGDAREALERYRLVADRWPLDSLTLRALMRSGDLLASAGNPRDARASYQRALAHPSCSDLIRPSIERALAKLPPPSTKLKDDDKLELER